MEDVDFNQKSTIIKETKLGEKKQIPINRTVYNILKHLFEKRSNSSFVITSNYWHLSSDHKRKAVEDLDKRVVTIW